VRRRRRLLGGWRLQQRQRHQPAADRTLRREPLGHRELPQPEPGRLVRGDLPERRDCWAAGSSANSTSQSLIEHYAGSSWVVVNTPNLGNFDGVTCASEVDCWAVGDTNNLTIDQALIARYAGSSWNIVSTPNPSPGSLSGLTCASAGDCWVPGNLNGVTCVSAGDCWAVGGDGHLLGQRLIEHYAGSSWAIVSTPKSSPGSLNGVTCLSTSQSLIEHYAGSRWAIVNSPNPSPG
jgi:hypothetical protein